MDKIPQNRIINPDNFGFSDAVAGLRNTGKHLIASLSENKKSNGIFFSSMIVPKIKNEDQFSDNRNNGNNKVNQSISSIFTTSNNNQNNSSFTSRQKNYLNVNNSIIKDITSVDLNIIREQRETLKERNERVEKRLKPNTLNLNSSSHYNCAKKLVGIRNLGNTCFM